MTDADAQDPAQPAELWNDDTATKLGAGTLAAMQHDYLTRPEAEQDALFIELADGSQMAYNRNRQPPGWDEI